MLLSRLFAAFLICYLPVSAAAQTGVKSRIFVGFYNCENLFDTLDDPGKQDEEFTPSGKYRYTSRIYRQKLANIAAVIRSMNSGDGPAVLGMAEVENNNVLNDLVHEPALAGTNYKYAWFRGPDPRGINVALLYNASVFRVLQARPVPVDISRTAGKAETRDILYVSGILYGDTVHLFVNHWPSRRGGEDESGPKRAIAAHTVKDAISRVATQRRGANIIVMGDFNDNPADASLITVLSASCTPGGVAGIDLYNPFCAMHSKGEGTEVYRHQWNLFDQVIVSGSLLSSRPGKLHYDRAEIHKPSFIIDTYKGHEGEPHRSFKGTKWINGYSDHFPVGIYLRK